MFMHILQRWAASKNSRFSFAPASDILKSLARAQLQLYSLHEPLTPALWNAHSGVGAAHL